MEKTPKQERPEMKSMVPSALMLFAAVLAGTSCALPRQKFILNEQTKSEVIDSALSALNQYYVLPEMAQKMETAIRVRQARGEYDRTADPSQFASMLGEHLREVSHDPHLLVRYSETRLPGDAEVGPSADEVQRYLETLKRNNYGFANVELLEGNIGYLDLREFASPDEAGGRLAAAMKVVADTDALIIDLRQNFGGSPAMVAALCSYFFERRTHLTDIYWRPGNQTYQSWTSETVEGKKYGDKPIWVLTSQNTFSAAEELAYDLQQLNRATIVGEKTGGGAHTTKPHRLHDHFGMQLPAGRAINPISKANWAGSGVLPDVSVPAAEALQVAQAAAQRTSTQAPASNRK
jgi:hypothetical protein